jgi:hypothetical protein
VAIRATSALRTIAGPSVAGRITALRVKTANLSKNVDVSTPDRRNTAATILRCACRTPGVYC